MELTIEQKRLLCEKILKYTPSWPNRRGPVSVWKLAQYHSENEYNEVFWNDDIAPVTHFGLMISNGNRGWDKFEPESNMGQAVMLLDRLRNVSCRCWTIRFHTEEGKYTVCDSKAVNGYFKSGNNLCELIVDACLWWLKNHGEKQSV